MNERSAKPKAYYIRLQSICSVPWSPLISEWARPLSTESSARPRWDSKRAQRSANTLTTTRLSPSITERKLRYLKSRGMFGNLFEEDEEEGFSSTSSKGRVSKAGDEPPPARGRANLCGIKNQGGTCYLNSLLQTLLFTPEFRGMDRCLFLWRSICITVTIYSVCFMIKWCVCLQRSFSVWGQTS